MRLFHAIAVLDTLLIIFRLFGCLGIHFTENQFRCLVRSNILRKMLSVLRKIKLCNQNRKTKRRENLINHSTASNGKVRVIQFNPIPHSHFPTNQTDPQKRQNLEKKFIKSGQWADIEREVTGFDLEARLRGRGEGEIEQRRRDRAALESIFAWLAQCCDWRDWCDWCGATIDETGAIWCDRRGAAIDETDGVWVVELELSLRSALLWESSDRVAVRDGNGLKWKYERKWF